MIINSFCTHTHIHTHARTHARTDTHTNTSAHTSAARDGDVNISYKFEEFMGGGSNSNNEEVSLSVHSTLNTFPSLFLSPLVLFQKLVVLKLICCSYLFARCCVWKRARTRRENSKKREEGEPRKDSSIRGYCV